MKIIVPVSAHDKHLLPAFTDCLLKFGGLEEHPVLFFPLPAAKEETFIAAERLGAEVHPLEQNYEGGSPLAPNRHFANTVFALGQMGNTSPFLWMELDMLPVKPRWAVALFEDYRYGGTPFRGAVVDTPFNDNGSLVFRSGDTMMMGTGIYPPNMDRDERIKPLLADLTKPGIWNPPDAFDVYLRWVIKNIGVSNTPLISDMWATQNYRMAEGMLICDSVDHGDRVVRAREGSVSLKALLVHGCKDGSLARLLLEGEPAKAQTLVGGWGVETTTVEADVESFQEAAKNVVEAVQGDDFWGGEDQPAKEPPVEAKPEEKTKPVPLPKPKKEAPAKPEPAPVAKITRADIEAALDGKKMRINDLAKKLKMGVPDLLGTFPTTGYTVVASGWVQSTIAITEA
jgi:hypothetical protein